MKDRDLDALVAERIMGFEWRRAWNEPRIVLVPPFAFGYSSMKPAQEGDERFADWDHYVHRYSASIAEAWLVVEEMRRRGWDFILEVVHDKSRIHPKAGIFDAQFSSRDGEGQAYTDDTPSRAICLAALKALQVEIER